MTELKNPKEVQIDLSDGTSKTYIISKFPAVAGRKIVANYLMSALPKLGDYDVNEETMVDLMSYVAVVTPAGPLRLTTRALVDNHVSEWEALADIEIAMMEYNCSFLSDGRAATFFGMLTDRAQGLITQTLSGLSGALTRKAARRSKNGGSGK